MARRHSRSSSSEEVNLDITAFMNLMVVLVPFLLVMAVFSRMAILELNLPPAADPNAAPPENPEQQLQLEVIVREKLIDVADQKGGLIRRVENKDDEYDLQLLSEALQELKSRLPADKTDISLLLEPKVSYENIISIYDTLRLVVVEEEGESEQYELFPDIALGDAPVIVNEASTEGGK